LLLPAYFFLDDYVEKRQPYYFVLFGGLLAVVSLRVLASGARTRDGAHSSLTSIMRACGQQSFGLDCGTPMRVPAQPHRICDAIVLPRSGRSLTGRYKRKSGLNNRRRA